MKALSGTLSAAAWAFYYLLVPLFVPFFVFVPQKPEAKSYFAEITVEEHRLFELTPEFEIPEGWKIVSLGGGWKIPPQVDSRMGVDGKRFGTAPPGDYKIVYSVQIGKTKIDSDGDEVILIPIVPLEQTWNVHVQGERPPPEPEKPDGVRNAIMLYDEESAPPVAGEAAAIKLREAKVPVVFTAVGTDPPTFLAKPVAAAREVGFPALIVMDGLEVTRAVRLPATAAAIVEEVKKP